MTFKEKHVWSSVEPLVFSLVFRGHMALQREGRQILTGGSRGEDVQNGGLEGGGGPQTDWNRLVQGTIYLVQQGVDLAVASTLPLHQPHVNVVLAQTGQNVLQGCHQVWVVRTNPKT